MKQSNFQLYSSSKEAWIAIQEAILGAQKSIYWELYIFIDDEVGRPFFDVLEQKAKTGVDVKIIVDSFGSFWLSRERVKSMRSAGVELFFFSERSKKIRGWWKRLFSRTHRKCLVVDEQIGFVGGVNIEKDSKDWFDIQLRVEGKVVHSLLRAFARSYIICGGNVDKVKHLLKYKFRVKSDEAEMVADEPDLKNSNARNVYVEAFLKARERVILFSPYYFPDKKFILALWQARKRGVKVDLLIPFRTDVRLSTYASYVWFSFMSKLGVNIHFFNKMFHGKGVIVDDEWAMIGSSNIEKTSFYDNYEMNLKVKEKESVKKIKNIVLNWMNETIKFDKDRWAKRGMLVKFKIWLAKTFYRFWHGDR